MSGFVRANPFTHNLYVVYLVERHLAAPFFFQFIKEQLLFSSTINTNVLATFNSTNISTVISPHSRIQIR